MRGKSVNSFLTQPMSSGYKIKKTELNQAILKLEKIVEATVALPELAKSTKEIRKNKTIDKNLKALKYIELSKKLFSARRFTYPVFVFYVSLEVESIYSDIIEKGGNPTLEEISRRIRVVEKASGLKDDEYWPVGEGPEELQELNIRYESVSDEIFNTVLDSLALNELAAVRRKNKAAYDRLREYGRAVLPRFCESEILSQVALAC